MKTAKTQTIQHAMRDLPWGDGLNSPRYWLFDHERKDFDTATMDGLVPGTMTTVKLGNRNFNIRRTNDGIYRMTPFYQ